MERTDQLAAEFEEHRAHLRAVAYRMLGSVSEADDALQDAWLRVTRADASGVENMGGWLTTIVARVCLNMLRSRRTRREEPRAPARPGRRAGTRSRPAPAARRGRRLLRRRPRRRLRRPRRRARSRRGPAL